LPDLPLRVTVNVRLPNLVLAFAVVPRLEPEIFSDHTTEAPELIVPPSLVLPFHPQS
jgi:hypothetical protein